MRRSRAPSIAPGTFSAAPSSADCTTNMFGFDLRLTQVQKVSNLILNMNIYLRDVHTGHLITSMSADFRGNTDESWSRAASYLLRNRVLAPNYGAQQ
jgi:hypothetical protein